tara:strand:- start:844 stop:1344 length:501 start_codon:yes stop_codon:yes gene_type:complete
MTTTECPVPSNQIPIKEYRDLTESLFFKWPIKGKVFFYKQLFISWLIITPIIILISSGSHVLIHSPLKLISISLVWSTAFPLILSTRHFLSWYYIYKRLRSENVEYEESGWYDGQIWEKSIEMREKDLLTAQYDIKPILDVIREALLYISIIFIFGLISTYLIFEN